MSNLPKIAQLTFPAADLTTQKTATKRVHATFAWDYEKGDFKLKDGKLIELTGLDYVKAWAEKALLTIKNTLIYEGVNYGSEHYSLIGKNFYPDFEKSEYTRMLREALMQNDAITGVENFSFLQTGSRLMISCTVQSIYGATNGQVVI